MIVPVIDIKDEKAVSGKLGKFGEYEELRSVVCKSSDPLDVAKTYEDLGFEEVYIADLDGILDSKPNLEIIEKIVTSTNLSVMLDIGIWSKEMIILMEEVKPVIASETFCTLDLLEFPHEVVLCIDTREGELIAETCGELFTLIDLIKDSTRIQEIILLDLNRMGLSQGPNLELCRSVVPRLPEKKLIYGGGIRDFYDVYVLEKLGVDKVLVGAALHSGSIFKDG
ncbi:MAG: hypothetical protein JW778_02470 [Candidatus Altiarchaeota archaeon]|nr:hypothetical protein [Candidatus Altiarchaeota archaeon]